MVNNLFSNQDTLKRLKGGQAWAPPWWAVLLIGLALWLAAVGAVFVTGNIIVLPTIVLLGSFMVPVTGVVWYLDHDGSAALSPRRIVSGFIIAGVLGILVASLLEFWLVYGPGTIGLLKVGFIEEFVKGAAIVLLAWGLGSYTTRDGMVLGAAVGFGFAALESSGYALASLFVVQGHQLVLSLSSVVFTELVRGVLAPFGHGLWSAILGGVIFHAARRGHLRLRRGLDLARGVRHLRRDPGVHRDFDHRDRAAGVPLAPGRPGSRVAALDTAGSTSSLKKSR